MAITPLGVSISSILALAIIFLLWYWIKRIRTNAAMSSAIAKGGPSYQRAAAGFETIKKELDKERATEQAIEREFKTGDKTSRKLGRLVEKQEEAETRAEEVTTKLEETTALLTAELEVTTNEILATVEEKIITEAVQEKEIVKIEALEKRLRFLNKLDRIDEATAKYLHDYFQSLANHTRQQLEYEQTSEAHHKTFVNNLKTALRNLQLISQEAKRQMNIVRRKENKERRNFNRELRAILVAITSKKWRLRIEKFRGRNADATLIAQLEREIALLQKNEQELAALTAQLTQTHNMLDAEIKKLRELLRQIVAIVRSQRRFNRTLNRRDKDLRNRLRELGKQQQTLEKSIAQLNSPERIHGVILNFSQHLNNYFTFYVTILQEDVSFEEKLRAITTQHYLIEQKMAAFSIMFGSLNETEAALDQGTNAILNIVATLMTQDISVSLQEQRRVLQRELAALDYETRTQKALAALAQELGKKTLLAQSKIDELLQKEKRILAENQALQESESQHLANSFGTMVSRKVALDENYMQKAIDFGAKLQKRNEIAAATYQEALKKAA